MAKIIQVTPDQLDTAAAKIESLATEYKSLYDQFYSKTNAMATSWSGKDNLAFINQIDGFKDDFNKMHAEMIRYVDFLRASARSYRETQNNVVTEAKKLIN